ncbi:MAG: tol-pal system YbgF family protein [Candidatus Pacearchaeota archaeon]
MERKILVRDAISKNLIEEGYIYSIDREGNLVRALSEKERKNVCEYAFLMESELIDRFSRGFLGNDLFNLEESEIDSIGRLRKSTHCIIVAESIVVPKKGYRYEIDGSGNIIEIDIGKENDNMSKRAKSQEINSISDWSENMLLDFAYKNRGDFKYNPGNPQKAIYYFNELLDRNPNKPRPTVLKGLAECYEKVGDFKKSLYYYNWAFERYPIYKKNNYIKAHFRYCEEMLRKGGIFDFNEIKKWLVGSRRFKRSK